LACQNLNEEDYQVYEAKQTHDCHVDVEECHNSFGISAFINSNMPVDSEPMINPESTQSVEKVGDRLQGLL